MQLPQVEAGLVHRPVRRGDPRSWGVRLQSQQFSVTQPTGSRLELQTVRLFRRPGRAHPATVINGAPILIGTSGTGSAVGAEELDGGFEGPIRMRTALTKSGPVSIRILQAIGPQYAQDYVSRFGFDPKLHPAYLTMALGAGSVTALDLAAGYAVFANGGYRVTPYFISRIEDASGKVLAKASPVRAGEGAQRAIDVRNAFVMFNMMQDVIRGGTGARAMQLGREDLAGKTGTTNDQMDARSPAFNGT